jgi:threonine synthase
MLFQSTRRAAPIVTFSEAVARGLAPDGGLYVPVEYPLFPMSFWQNLRGSDIHEIAYKLFKEFLIDELDHAQLKSICTEVFSFQAPIVPIADRAGVMELFHGPTLAFKDFGAGFMAKVLPLCKKSSNDRPITVLTATSGDTGAAVARGFFGIEGVQVVILYPKGKVSPLQERQFATLGDNITAVSVDGTFDDCQRLVKDAFSDENLVQDFNLTSANSINIARLLPQMVYYVYAWSMIPMGAAGKGITFVVPSGNFGNLVAGLMITKMGLPGVKFIAATNSNDTVPSYLSGEKFEPKKSVQTISNAMDVGNPSNFERLTSIFDNNDTVIRENLRGYSVDDEKTKSVIKRVWVRHKYLVDPHTATGLEVWNNVMSQPENLGRFGIVLSTAHPAKFREVIDEVLPDVLQLPATLQDLNSKELLNIDMGASASIDAAFLAGI